MDWFIGLKEGYNVTNKLKLYVWEDYAPDYATGLAFAIAENEERAFELLTAIDGFLGDCGPVTVYDISEIAFSQSGGM